MSADTFETLSKIRQGHILYRQGHILDSTDWLDYFKDYEDVDDVSNFFMYNLKKYFNECFPLITVSRKKHNYKPWITPALKKSIIKKNKMLAENLKNPSPERL